MPVVTVNGAGNLSFPVTYTSNDAFGSATTLANSINSLVAGGSVATQVYAGGAVTPPGAGQVGQLVITANGTSVALGNDAIGVVNASGPTTLLGGAGSGRQVSVIAGSGGLTFNTNGGSASVVAGDGNNLIGDNATGTETLNVRTGAGNDTILGLVNTNIIQAGAGSNTIYNGLGNNLIISTGVDSVYGAIGASGGSDTIIALGTAVDSISGFGSNMYFVDLGTSPSTLFGGTGSDTVFASTGGGSYVAGSGGNSTLVGGQAAVTLTGSASGDILFDFGQKSTAAGAVNSSPVLIAGAGNETIGGIGGSLDSQVFAGNNTSVNGALVQANTVISMGAGNDTITAGTGNATINGGAGNDVIGFINGRSGGNDLIFSFNSNETIRLSGYGTRANGLTEAQNAVGSATVGGGNTTIALADNTRITFINFTTLNTSNFS